LAKRESSTSNKENSRVVSKSRTRYLTTPETARHNLAKAQRADAPRLIGPQKRSVKTAVAKRSVPWRSILLRDLADPRVAAGYLTEASKDSPAMYKSALRDVAEAHRANPVQLAVPLDPDVKVWLLSLGKRAPRRVNAILRAAMKAAKDGK